MQAGNDAPTICLSFHMARGFGRVPGTITKNPAVGTRMTEEPRLWPSTRLSSRERDSASGVQKDPRPAEAAKPAPPTQAGLGLLPKWNKCALLKAVTLLTAHRPLPHPKCSTSFWYLQAKLEEQKS